MRGGLRAAAALVTAAIVIALLAPERGVVAPGAEPQSVPDPPDAIEIARIELPVEPPPPEPPREPESEPRSPSRPKPPPPPEPPTQPAADATPVVPAPDTVARGEALLRSGSFPRLRASYARIGFPRYRDAVLALGGAFYLFDRERRRPVAQLDPRTGLILEQAPGPELSRWPRDVTRHLPEALASGQARYGSRVSRVILLPPSRVDAALLGALDYHLRSLHLESGALVRVDVAYVLDAGRLQCDVLAVALRDGSERPLDLRIDLTGRIAS